MAEKSASRDRTPPGVGSDGADRAGAGWAQRPLGFGAQFGRTREALVGLIAAHFKLLSAELSEIMDEIKRAAALAGAALGLLVLAGMLTFVGSILWLDEWAFGSIGWGVLHGATGLIALAVVLLLAIIPGSGARIGLGFLIAIIGAVVAAVALSLVASWNLAIALALFLFLFLWPISAAVFVIPNADWDAFKKRYTPEETIETTKETIEWVREQLPLKRKS